MIDKPGIYDIPFAEYLADPCTTPSLSSSIALEMLEDAPELEYCAECHRTGMVPQDLASFLGLDGVTELRYRPPRDSVFLTLPAPEP